MVFSWELPDCFWLSIGNKGKQSSFFLCQTNIYCEGCWKGCAILYLEKLIDDTLVYLLRKFWWNQSNAIKLSLVKGQVHVIKHLQFASVCFFSKLSLYLHFCHRLCSHLSLFHYLVISFLVCSHLSLSHLFKSASVCTCLSLFIFALNSVPYSKFLFIPLSAYMCFSLHLFTSLSVFSILCLLASLFTPDSFWACVCSCLPHFKPVFAPACLILSLVTFSCSHGLTTWRISVWTHI